MFADPEKILKNFGIASTMIVADLGAGSGFYSIASAHQASEGKVYVVDVQKDFLTSIKIKAEKEALRNLEYIWGDIEKIGGTKIADGIVDVVIISNVLFLADAKKKIIEETKRILKHNGRVLFVEWSESSFIGPRQDQVVSQSSAKNMFTEFGFTFDRDITGVGDHHYGMIFKKL